ncbi:MAG TPA: helix-turn-helix transcriptional regulator [Acidimicrobiales bacterium]|nr:helix-turn-helix transcriptional regulator [Acidimicrobiales bacterium]
MSGPDVPVDGGDGLASLSSLSEREREILTAAAAGLPAREIAVQFSLSEATVRSHLSSIYSKLGVSGRVELLARLTASPAPLGAAKAADPNVPATPRRQAGQKSIRASRIAIVLAAVVAAAVVAGAFLVLRPDLPPRSDLGTVSRLVSSGQVTDLSLVGERLTVTEVNGQRLRVEGVNDDRLLLAAASLAQAEGRPISVSRTGGASEIAQLAILASALLPPIVVVVIAGLVLRALGRRFPPARTT